MQGVWHPECFVCAVSQRGAGLAHLKATAMWHWGCLNMCGLTAGLDDLRCLYQPYDSPLQDCMSSFTNGSFFELEGRPYCELHFHQRQGSVCHGCGRPITGRCITAAGRKYHPEHFICSYCLGQLHKGTFLSKEKDQRLVPSSDLSPKEPTVCFSGNSHLSALCYASQQPGCGELRMLLSLHVHCHGSGGQQWQRVPSPGGEPSGCTGHTAGRAEHQGGTQAHTASPCS
uniref:Leupaxin n=1 Tax=Coturnix japonica TaxID=93934 RepID=A0A8C2U4T7_COTJA